MSVHNIKYVSHQSAAVLSLLFEKVVEGPSRHSIALFYTHMWIGLVLLYATYIYVCVHVYCDETHRSKECCRTTKRKSVLNCLSSSK